MGGETHYYSNQGIYNVLQKKNTIVGGLITDVLEVLLLCYNVLSNYYSFNCGFTPPPSPRRLEDVCTLVQKGDIEQVNRS